MTDIAPTRQPTATSIHISPTLTTTTVPTSAPDWLETICPDVELTLPVNVNATGAIILVNRVEPYQVQLTNLETGNLITLTKAEDQSLLDFSVSLDKKWLAYNEVTLDNTGRTIISQRLVIVDSDGQQVKIIPWEDNWAHISYWLSNDRLVISLDSEAPKVLLAVNPFTGERQELSPKFPDLFDFYPEDWGYSGQTIYDPSLSYVVYPREGNSYEAFGTIFEYVLWNLNGHEVVAYLPSLLVAWDAPIWSPDGTGFVAKGLSDIKGLHELFVVENNGLIRQLTDFSSYFDTYTVDHLSWSPDGRYIAFMLISTPSSYLDERLAIFDTRTKDVTLYCLQGDYLGPVNSMFREAVAPPIWAPNSQQLIIENRYAENESRVVLVDIVQGFAVQLAENMRPVGWMISPKE
jgi:hypothetical protein